MNFFLVNILMVDVIEQPPGNAVLCEFLSCEHLDG